MRRRGHTLAELMVVIAILVLLAGIAMPRFAASLQGRRGEAAAARLRDTFAYAHARAVATGLRHVLRIDGESGRMTLYRFDPVLTGGQPPTAPVEEGRDDSSGFVEDKTAVTAEAFPHGVTLEGLLIAPLETAPEDPRDIFGARDTAGGDVISFYPDGTTDTVGAIVRDERGTAYILTMDERTGRTQQLDPEETRQVLEGLR